MVEGPIFINFEKCLQARSMNMLFMNGKTEMMCKLYVYTQHAQVCALSCICELHAIGIVT